MKCKIGWVDKDGKPTHHDAEAVKIANFHEIKWEYPTGNEHNKILGYTDKITQSFPICQHHLDKVEPRMHWPLGGWTFTEITPADILIHG